MKMLLAKVNDYAYDVWFEVIKLDVELNELTIYDHLLGKQFVMSTNKNMEFKVMEDDEE